MTYTLKRKNYFFIRKLINFLRKRLFYEHGGAWWSMVEYGGAWWSMVEHGGAWWSMVEHGGAWWSMVDPGGAWSLVEPGGAWWSMVEHGGAWWSMVDTRRTRGHEVDTASGGEPCLDTGTTSGARKKQASDPHPGDIFIG